LFLTSVRNIRSFIARRIRESKVLLRNNVQYDLEKIDALKPEGIILSGGPASVYQANAPKIKDEVFKLPVPFLGICYGMGMINLFSGGDVARAEQREYGPAELIVDNDADLFRGFGKNELVRVWMSHGDKMTSMPKGWQRLPIAAFPHRGLCRSQPAVFRRSVSS
jgi:GMP synthase (glutamine-hydrolysing)